MASLNMSWHVSELRRMQSSVQYLSECINYSPLSDEFILHSFAYIAMYRKLTEFIDSLVSFSLSPLRFFDLFLFIHVYLVRAAAH